jgi:hypothetical protein
MDEWFMLDKSSFSAVLAACGHIDVFLKLSGDAQGDPRGPVFWAFRPHPDPQRIGDDRFLQLCTRASSGTESSNNGPGTEEGGDGGSRGGDVGDSGRGSSSSSDKEALQHWQGDHGADDVRPVELFMEELWEVRGSWVEQESEVHMHYELYALWAALWFLAI